MALGTTDDLSPVALDDDEDIAHGCTVRAPRPGSRDARQVAVGVALRREHPLQVAHAIAQARIRLGLLDLAHVVRQLAAVARDEPGALVDLEAARLGEDAGQTGPD